ncbi:outer membrane protein assembly factor BamB family protein [Streptomyces niger]|uniref:outer membrane protein assembly factor BamB family protein n=1 Tax=Streptomyces niger TaxID=66373 RepID=UPI00069A7B82|nr:PQQ-binding-like beta-propeller repeat protein [Streptomyces niger]
MAHGETAGLDGAYRTLQDCTVPGDAGAVRHVLAREEGSGRIHTVMLPVAEAARDSAYGVRFRAEAANSRRLAGPYVAPVAGVAPPGAEPPWVAYDCFPALPLPAALAAHGGPLPTGTVQAMGVALADTLARAHANGLVHAGISRDAVLLTPYGPRLCGYGLVRTATLDGVDRGGVPGLDPFTLPPEQRSGGRPRPLGDVYALGALLAYAATGRATVEPAALPEPLRGPIAACLQEDPAQRPHPTVLAHDLAAAADAGVLPASVTQALAEQVRAHSEQSATDLTATAPAAPVPAPVDGFRRLLLTTLGIGAAGLVLGGGGAAVARAVAGTPSSGRRPLYSRGAAPAPLWRHELGGDVGISEAWRGRIVLITSDDAGTSALDLRTGKQLWSRSDLLPYSPMKVLGDGTVALADYSELTFFSLRTGRILWKETDRNGDEKPLQGLLVATEGNALWYVMIGSGDHDYDSDNTTLVGYDIKRRKETWHTPIPEQFRRVDDFDSPPLLTGDRILLPSDSFQRSFDDPKLYQAFRRDNGKPGSTYEFKDWEATDDGTLLAAGDLLVYTGAKAAHGWDPRKRSDRWKLPLGARIPKGSVAARQGTLYATDEDGTTYAVDMRSGERRWRRRTRKHLANAPWTTTVLSHSGRTVLQSNGSEIEALDTADGSVRWRLALTGSGQDAGGPAYLAGSAPGMTLVQHGKALYALPVD